jgi:hypothetical protein
MKWAVRVTVSLLLGCLISVSIAWATAAFGAQAWSDEAKEFTYTRGTNAFWVSVRPVSWCHDEVSCGFLSEVGVERLRTQVPVQSSAPHGTRVPHKQDLVTGTHRFGFPFRCVWGGDDMGRSGCFAWDEGCPGTVALWWSRPTTWSSCNGAQVRLPVAPLMSGLVADGGLYAIPVFAALSAGACRCGLRRRRGRCPRCGYDLKHDLAAGCPECGWRRSAGGAAAPK